MSEKEQKKGKGAKADKPAQKPGGKDAKQPAGDGKKPKQAKQAPEARQQATEARDERPETPPAPARLKMFYRDEVVKGLTQQFGYKSVMQVPRIEKIVLN